MWANLFLPSINTRLVGFENSLELFEKIIRQYIVRWTGAKTGIK